MKRLGIALILTCVLSVSALAGDIPTIGIASPSPSPTPTTQSTGTSSRHCHNDPSNRSQFDSLGDSASE